MCKADSNLNNDNDNDMDMLENMLADPLTSKQLEEMVKTMSVKPMSVKPTVRPVPKASVPKPKASVPKPQVRKPKTETESWSIADFERDRKELVEFVCDNICPLIENEIRRILVRAPVKSGKRGMVEFLAMRDKKSREKRVHAFVSAWHRAADKEQREELGEHNLKVFSIINDKSVRSFLKWLEDNMKAGNLIVVHLDECDHGSGDTQMLSKIWPKIRSDSRVTTILYSATPEEAMFSPEFDMREFTESHPPLFYTPPKGYCGSARFLEEGLVHDARPFFTKDGLSEQAKEIVSDMRAGMLTNPKRNLLILRLTYSLHVGVDRTENKAKHLFLKRLSSFKELSDFNVIVDKGDYDGNDIHKEEIEWSSKAYWDKKGTDKPLLIVHDQTATRSTEWSCHDRVFATHDYRKSVTYVSVSQAQERVNHYDAKYGGFQPIRVYGHETTFLLSAGKISYDEYRKKPEWSSKKVDKRKAVDAYVVRKTDSHVIHPVYNKYYSEEEADEILHTLHSYVEVKLSGRIAEESRIEYLSKSIFIACTKDDDIDGLFTEEYARLNVEKVRNFQNPFIASEKEGKKDGKYQGYMRGWSVLEYDQVKEAKWSLAGGDRITVCYNKGVLGVAARYQTKETKIVDTMRAYKSIYSDVSL